MNGKIIPGIDIKDINWEKCWFNPGCAMSIYKPELIEPMLTLLRKTFGDEIGRASCRERVSA